MPAATYDALQLDYYYTTTTLLLPRGSHFRCQFVTHYWHCLSSVCSWRPNYSAELLKHQHSFFKSSEWVSRGLTFYSTQYSSFRGRLLRTRWFNQQRQSTEASQIWLLRKASIPREPLHRVTRRRKATASKHIDKLGCKNCCANTFTYLLTADPPVPRRMQILKQNNPPSTHVRF